MGMKWDEKYSLGIFGIDMQHRRLFEIGQEVYSLILSKNGDDNYDRIIGLLGRLKDYALYHFDYEEKYMKIFGYADYEEHRMEHKLFVEKILEIETEDIDLSQKKVALEIVDFIVKWVSDHILGSDAKYRDYFVSKIKAGETSNTNVV